MSRFLSMFVLLMVTGCTVSHYTTTSNTIVNIYLRIPQAEEVLFASSADNYRYHAAARESKDLWVMRDLRNREFKYFYIVDGTLYVPECRFKEKDDFGTVNCIHQP